MRSRKLPGKQVLWCFRLAVATSSLRTFLRITRGHSLWTALAIASALITSTRNLSLARSLQRSLLATIRLNISRSFALALHQSYEPRSPRTFLTILRVSSLKSWITLVTVSTSWLSILQDQPDPFHSLSIAVKCHQVGVQVCRITHSVPILKNYGCGIEFSMEQTKW